jgi:hypothetical protein
VPFAYYDRLSPRQKAIYRASDAVAAVRLPGAEALRPGVADLAEALRRDDRPGVALAAGRLVVGITHALDVPAAAVEVLAVRPSLKWGELHGLYTSEGKPRIQVWMRTVRHRRVVAFRTFLRTLLHELCHHLDYVHLGLADSYHTEGFFKRESSLFRQLVPE